MKTKMVFQGAENIFPEALKLITLPHSPSKYIGYIDKGKAPSHIRFYGEVLERSFNIFPYIIGKHLANPRIKGRMEEPDTVYVEIVDSPPIRFIKIFCAIIFVSGLFIALDFLTQKGHWGESIFWLLDPIFLATVFYGYNMIVRKNIIKYCRNVFASLGLKEI